MVLIQWNPAADRCLVAEPQLQRSVEWHWVPSSLPPVAAKSACRGATRYHTAPHSLEGTRRHPRTSKGRRYVGTLRGPYSHGFLSAGWDLCFLVINIMYAPRYGQFWGTCLDKPQRVGKWMEMAWWMGMGQIIEAPSYGWSLGWKAHHTTAVSVPSEISLRQIF